MKRTDLVSVRRSEWSDLVNDVVSEVITLQYGVFLDVTEAPEYIRTQANKREVPPITLELIGPHERTTTEPTETKKPVVKSVEKEIEAEYTVKHKGSGKYDVISKDGQKMNEEPLTKEKATELIETLNN
jgi:hypothetical protein